MSYATKIANLEAILNSGATDVTVDGTRTVLNLDSVRKRIAELRRLDNAARRPVISQIDLSGF
jgi:hypothetical protein